MKYFERNKDYKFELAKNYSQSTPFFSDEFVCTSDFVMIEGRHIIIKKHYSWDGSSIPGKRFMERITFGKYDPDKYCKEASLVHDSFYQLMRLNLLDRKHKDAIDRLYQKMCIQGGMSKRQAARRYWAVKTFGHRTLKPRCYPEKEILET